MDNGGQRIQNRIDAAKLWGVCNQSAHDKLWYMCTRI